MTEVPLQAVVEQPASFGWKKIGLALAVGARALSLVMTFFVLRAFVVSSPSLTTVAQPLAIAGILLIAAFAKNTRAALLAVVYVINFILFFNLQPLADETFIAVHFDYPIVADRVLFLGSLPTLWLQDLLYTPGRIGALDLLLSGVYITYFFAPHVMALIVWRTRPQLFPRAIMALSLTFALGLFFYFAIPTAPPWLASDAGDIDAGVVRILPELSAQVAGDTYDKASRVIGRNDVAAMPSLHTALTCMVALILATYGPRWRKVGLTYLALMALALVYLGEHYVIDEIAGIALATGVWKLVSQHRAFAWLSPRATAMENDALLPAESKRAA